MNAKKTILIKCAVGISLLGGLASSALAVALGDSGNGNNYTGAYGEYVYQATSGPVNNSAYATATKNQGSYANSFQSFCLEANENVGGSGIQYVVNDEAVNGGANTHAPAGNQSGDRISVGTAWLYSQFAQGVLANYFTASNRSTVAGLLQNAIWALEDEINDPSNNIFFTLAATQFGGSAAAQANAATGQFGVWVLNNTENETDWRGNTTVKKRQDMLFYGGGASVPDGGSSVMLLGLGLSGLSLLSSRLKRQAEAA